MCGQATTLYSHGQGLSAWLLILGSQALAWSCPSPIIIASTELGMLEPVHGGGKGCLALGTMVSSPQHSEVAAPK